MTSLYKGNGRIPAGTIQAHGGANAPKGWLVCDGSIVSRAAYPRLFAAIGETWGAGDGLTTFKLPDLRDEFLRGASASLNVGQKQADETKSHSHSASSGSAGSHTHTGTANSAGSHTHTYTRPNWASNWGSSSNAGVPTVTEGVHTSSAGAHTHSLSINSNGAHTHSVTVNATGGAETRPRCAVVLMCIKY